MLGPKASRFDGEQLIYGEEVGGSRVYSSKIEKKKRRKASTLSMMTV
jgi:hypothetical protein